MIVTVTFKTPDAVSDALGTADLCDVERDQAEKAISKWVEYGEYISVRFDTDKGTATVLKAS
jgi:hypothetical protein